MTALRCALILTLVLLPASPFATTFPVTKTADTNDGTCDPDCSLREAIEVANANPGADDVPVPAGTYLLAIGHLVVSDDVEIAGTDASTTIIDAAFGNRVFQIQSGAVVAISDVTIQRGNHAYGGGIANHGDLTLTSSTVSDNRASIESPYHPFGSGGGISNTGALTLINSTVTRNVVADYAGGIDNLGGVATITLINSTVSSNHADFRGGGGIRNNGDMTLNNSTVSDNFGSIGGGILNSGDMVLTNSTVSGNYARYADYGAGISGNATLTDTIVADNDGDNCTGNINSLGYNLSGDTTCGLTEPSDLVVADAMLGPLQDNGGPTETHDLFCPVAPRSTQAAWTVRLPTPINAAYPVRRVRVATLEPSNTCPNLGEC